MTSLASSTRPIFGTLERRSGERHIFVLDGDGIPAVMRLLNDVHASRIGGTDILLLRSSGTDDGQSELAAISRLTVFATEPDLIAALGEILQGASMITQLYVAGAEALILETARCGMAFGLRPDAILTELRGAARRRAQCVHCKTIYRNVDHRAFVCCRCDLTVVVRDHYSRRIGAYQAVMIDPGDPELPAFLSERFE